MVITAKHYGRISDTSRHMNFKSQPPSKAIQAGVSGVLAKSV
jgi:hypothetical protein